MFIFKGWYMLPNERVIKFCQSFPNEKHLMRFFKDFHAIDWNFKSFKLPKNIYFIKKAEKVLLDEFLKTGV